MSDSDEAISIFLCSNFRPVKSEKTINALHVEGLLPEEVDGLYLRIGPNPHFEPVPPYHWFDGDGMVHVINLNPPDSASYLNRYIQTEALKTDLAAGYAAQRGLRHPPDIIKTLNGDMPYRNPANTAVLFHHGRSYALCEFGEPYEFTLPDAVTLGPVNLGFNSGMTFNAHPKVDPVSGELLYLRHRQGTAPYLSYGLLDKNGSPLYEMDVDTPYPGMMHDFTFTTHFIVLMLHSLHFDTAQAEAGKPAWVFNPDIPARFAVIPRGGEGSQVRWFEVTSCCVTHFVNAWEKGDEIVISGIRYQYLPEALTFSGLVNAPEQSAGRPVLYEWRLNQANGQVTERELSAHPLEYPALNPMFCGQPFRYAYLSMEGHPGGVAKFDYHKGVLQTHLFGRGRYGGEATFVPRRAAQKEDDGYLLVIVWDSASNQSELLILNALDLTDAPVARVLLSVRVPFGFHASFIPRAGLSAGERSCPDV